MCAPLTFPTKESAISAPQQPNRKPVITRLGFTLGTSTSTSSTLYVGSLQLDFLDVASKSTVFRAIGTKTIDAKAKPDK